MKKGRIECITGPMFSGKTTRLLDISERLQHQGVKVQLVKWNKDDRYCAGKIQTHDKKKEAEATCVPNLMKQDFLERGVQAVLIDEGQFLEGVLTFAEDISTQGKDVYISFLDYDFRKQPFEYTKDLCDISTSYTVLKGKCDTKGCGRQSRFTKKHHGKTEAVIEIGGSELYSPVCAECFVLHPSFS